ncbi:hypothetical protein [Burkholderia vietnamiensis]|uniref:hypothetical protein n=1 Tax=Burkholderia vietnamiensis TaxID=60552 RepID=UPI000AAC99EC|nr:hypothetical protein [Burkholderia vietnamiensis]
MKHLECNIGKANTLGIFLYWLLLCVAVLSGCLSYFIADLVIVNGWHHFGWPAVALALIISVGITVYSSYLYFRMRSH